MPTRSFEQTFERFSRLAANYLTDPSIPAGIVLDEAANHLKRAAGQLPDPVLTALIHRFLRAIPPQDTATLAALLEQIQAQAKGYTGTAAGD